ncbi:MAG: MFS transporter [Betaproteobacteria bacterium]|nr:MFS transporter [Betaproteobacteria bacterium]
MTTIVVVKKNNQIAIAGDSLVTFGDTRLAHGYETNEKIFKVGDSYVGLAGTVAHFPVLRKALRELQAANDSADFKLGSRDDVFATFQKLHPILKENFFLNTKEEDSDPYESSQLTCLIANPTGIYGVYSYREVFEFERFWGIGSGRSFALGAMWAVWDKAKTAKEVAEVGVRAGAEFDKNSAAPHQMFILKTARAK